MQSALGGYYAPTSGTSIADKIDGDPVGGEYYSPAGSITRTACSGKTRSGGVGTADDCVAYMTMRTSKNSVAPMLRKGVKGNSPKSLCVKNGADTYYGNLVTNPITGAVRLNIGGTTYYLTDNSNL